MSGAGVENGPDFLVGGLAEIAIPGADAAKGLRAVEANQRIDPLFQSCSGAHRTQRRCDNDAPRVLTLDGIDGN